MKAFIIVLILLLLIISISVVNACFVTSFANEMLAYIEKTPNSTALFSRDSMAGYFDRWEQKRKLVSLSVNFDYINDAERAAYEMYRCGLSDGDSDYLAAKAQLISCLRVIRDVETFSLFNII